MSNAAYSAGKDASGYAGTGGNAAYAASANTGKMTGETTSMVDPTMLSAGATAVSAIGDGITAYYQMKQNERLAKRQERLQRDQMKEGARQFDLNYFLEKRASRMNERLAQQALDKGQIEIDKTRMAMRTNQQMISSLARQLKATGTK